MIIGHLAPAINGKVIHVPSRSYFHPFNAVLLKKKKKSPISSYWKIKKNTQQLQIVNFFLKNANKLKYTHICGACSIFQTIFEQGKMKKKKNVHPEKNLISFFKKKCFHIIFWIIGNQKTEIANFSKNPSSESYPK